MYLHTPEEVLAFLQRHALGQESIGTLFPDDEDLQQVLPVHPSFRKPLCEVTIDTGDVVCRFGDHTYLRFDPTSVSLSTVYDHAVPAPDPRPGHYYELRDEGFLSPRVLFRFPREFSTP